MKLAMLSSSINREGKEEAFIVDWIESLAQEVDQLVVILLRDQKTLLKAKNVTVYSVEKTPLLFKPLIIWKLLSQEQLKVKFDGIFCHIYDFLAVVGTIWAKIFTVKSVYWYAGGLPLNSISLLRLAMVLADKVVTCSQKEKQRYSQAFHLKNSVHVLGHAINTHHFKPLLPKIHSHKSDYVIGSVGRATSVKNYETLISAVQQLPDLHFTLKLALSRVKENQDYVSRLKHLADQDSSSKHHYQFLTNINYTSLPQFYTGLSLYIHPSELASIDKAGLEAIACGIPVLLSRAGYLEVVSDDQFLFDPKDVKALTNKIIQALRKTPFEAQAKLQKHIEKEYALQGFMKKLVALY
jgi:glycosyltransferase involved in cell wall biosynthesis